MTLDEWKLVAAVISAGCGKGFTTEEISVWHECLKDLPASSVKAAALRFLSEDGQFVSIAKLRRLATDQEHGQLDSPATAVGRIFAAIRRWGWYDEERGLQALDELCRKAVFAVGGWKAICDSENHETTSAQLRNAYEMVSRQETQMRALPENLRPRIGNVTCIADEKRIEDPTPKRLNVSGFKKLPKPKEPVVMLVKEPPKPSLPSQQELDVEADRQRQELNKKFSVKTL